MENQNEVIKGQLTEEEVTELVAKYPNSYAAIFELETGEKACIYLKKIEREIFVQGNKFMSTKDELTTCEYLLKNIWIGGYAIESIIKDFDALKNCAATIIPVLFVKAGELKKN